MGDSRHLELEAGIRGIPGILGCVILTKAGGSTGEVQAFTRMGSDREAIHAAILERVEEQSLTGEITTVHVFELDAESIFGDRQTLERAAELAEQEARARGLLSLAEEAPSERETGPGSDEHWRPDSPLESRPLLQRVVLSASTSSAEAEVSLGAPEGAQVVGSSSGTKTLHGMKVVAQATLDACRRLVDGFDAELRGASLVNVVGQEAVIVLVRLRDELDLLGSALLRNGPASEAAVRATLDAVNRLLLRRG